MQPVNLTNRIVSIALICLGVILLGLTIFVEGALNIALPLVFLLIGGGFILLYFIFKPIHSWASFLFIPAFLIEAFGIIFLLNVITNDWKSWAYAWLLLVAAIGIGILFADRDHHWHPAVKLTGLGMSVLGVTFFAVFGAIAGGLFIKIIAPVILVAAGLALRWINLESILPQSIFKNFPRFGSEKPYLDKPSDGSDQLVDGLSSRELEVLRLIDLGLTNQQIADQLTVAPSTVKTHINNIYGKLGVKTRIQAIMRCHELGIIQ